jgi:hypothetical protein
MAGDPLPAAAGVDEVEELQALETTEQEERLLAMSTKQLRKLKRDILLQKKKKRKQERQEQEASRPAGAADAAFSSPPGQPSVTRHRVGEHWGNAAAQLVPEPSSPRPYPYRDVEALMWIAGDVCSCGTAGVGTVDWMVDELREWGSALVAEAAARNTSSGAAATAGVEVVVRLKDVQAVLPVACAQYEALSTETKKARTAQHLESHMTEVADMPAAELRSVAGGGQSQARPQGQHLRGSSSGPDSHPASSAAAATTTDLALAGPTAEMGVESSKDFIGFADERTKRMRSRSELFAFTKARETSLLRKNRPAGRGLQQAAARSGVFTHGNDFIDWLLGHGHAGCRDDDFARSPEAPESAWDDEEGDYDNIEDTDGDMIAGNIATAVTGMSAVAVRATAGDRPCRVTIGSDARGVIASLLRSRLFGIVSIANRARHAHGAGTRDGEAGEQPAGHLRELSCALTVVELVEAKAQLRHVLPFLSWAT